MIIKSLMLISIMFMLSGCIVGTIVSLPFKAVGAVVPGPVGTGIGAAGTVADMAIPF